jgi:hypothetical protein
MSLEVIRYPLGLLHKISTVISFLTAPYGIHGRWWHPLRNVCHFQKLQIPSGGFFRGLPVTSDNLCNKFFRTSSNNFTRGLPVTFDTFQEVRQISVPRGDLCAKLLENLRFNKTRKQLTVFKSIIYLSLTVHPCQKRQSPVKDVETLHYNIILMYD